MNPGEKRGCCAPQTTTPAGGAQPVAPLAALASDEMRDHIAARLIAVAGGTFRMGTDQPRYAEDMDSPARPVDVAPFRLSRVTVTNRLFARFVAESGYRTTAEREGWSFVFHSFLPDSGAGLRGPIQAPWWREVRGATWFSPEGPGSDIARRMDHPAIHVSWDDAMAFCAFTGTRLPTEVEWEYAARGGLEGQHFPWGDEMTPQGTHRHNTWQGHFPSHDSAEDGYAGTAPVEAYQPNRLGFFNMTGNVWEWTAAMMGPLPGTPDAPPGDDRLRVVRGGSYLCHASYCERYFVHSRTFNTPNSSTGHTGFRVAARVA